MASASERVVINCNDILSCDSERHVLGDSTDGDSDDNDVGVDQGVSIPNACKSEVVIADPVVGPHLAPSASAVLAVDEFYNAVEKASHLDVIVPKKESRWWVNQEMWKKKKAEERTNATLELQRAINEAAQENATLVWELNRARFSTSGGTGSVVLSTSANSVGGP